MTSPDTAFAEGSAKNNISFNFGVGVFGVASICVAVFVVLLCVNKDRNSKSKKIPNDSRKGLPENQLLPARHGIENKMYTAVQNGIGEFLLSQNESSVSHGSSPKGVEGRSQNSVSQSPLSPHLTQHSGLKETEKTIYDISSSKKPTQTIPIVFERDHILFESNRSEVNSNPLPSENKMDSDGCIPEHLADNLYLVPESNKPRDEKKPIPSPKMFKRSKEDRMCAHDLVMSEHFELPNTCHHARSMHTYLNLMPTLDGEKYDDILHEPWHEKTEENLIPISASREGKLFESKTKENKFQYTDEGTDDMFPFPEVDPLTPPTPCRFITKNVPMTRDQKMSVTNYIDTETEEHGRYINCKEFPKRSENLERIKSTDLCPPAPCYKQRYINIPHTSGKELEEDNEYVAMINHDDVLDKQTRENVNLQYSPVLLTTEKTSNIYLTMTKHLTRANSDKYIYQNTKWKENKTMYVNSLSFESSLNGCHDSEKDDVYSYASVDFFLKNKMAADTANKFCTCINKDVCINEGDCINEVQNPSVRAQQFLTATSAKEMDVRSQTSKSQKLDKTVFVSNTFPAGKQT